MSIISGLGLRRTARVTVRILTAAQTRNGYTFAEDVMAISLDMMGISIPGILMGMVRATVPHATVGVLTVFVATVTITEIVLLMELNMANYFSPNSHQFCVSQAKAREQRLASDKHLLLKVETNA
jgi:hypothetical protein